MITPLLAAPPPRRVWPELAICAAFLAAALLTRLPVLSRSVLDWDESLYLLMAQQWLAGHLPYTTIWDNKPIGIYAVFAVFEAVFGGPVSAIRMASMGCAGISGFLIYRVIRQLGIGPGRGPALFGGGAYLLCGLGNDGLAANTEPFMACATLAAVAVASSATLRRWPRRQAGLAGLAVGAAFMIKYVSVLEAPAVLLLLLWRPAIGWRGRVTTIIAFTAGAVLPLGLTVLLYWRAGALPLWWRCAVAANFRRAGAPVTAAAIDYAARIQMLRWGPLFLAGFAVPALGARRLWRGRPFVKPDVVPLFLAIWLLCGCLGVAAAKSFYDHYFLQILPVLCVCLGWWAARLARARPVVLAVCGAAALALPAWAAATALRDGAAPVLQWANARPIPRPDVPALVARDLAAPLAAGGGLYVFDGEPVLYALTGQTPPTRYAFPSVLTTRFLAHVAGVAAAPEVTRILATRPLFIVRNPHPRRGQNPLDPAVYALVNAALAAHYQLWKSYPGVEVYRRD